MPPLQAWTERQLAMEPAANHLIYEDQPQTAEEPPAYVPSVFCHQQLPVKAPPTVKAPPGSLDLDG